MIHDPWRIRLYGAIGDAVRKRRVEANMTLSQMAKACRVSASTMQHFEDGSACPLHVLVRIAHEIDCSLDELVPVLTDAGDS